MFPLMPHGARRLQRIEDPEPKDDRYHGGTIAQAEKPVK
jgi:hypothetical protein